MSSSAPSGQWPADDLEKQACVALARALDPNDQIFQAALERAKEWRGHRKKVRRARYAVIAMALREAVLERIHPRELSARLATKGEGIAALASRFAATHTKNRRINGSDREAMKNRREGVSFTWSKERLAFWNKLPANDGIIKLIVLKQDSGEGAVIWVEGPFRQMPSLS